MSITWGVLAQSPKPQAHDKVLDNNPDRIGIWKCWVLRRGENRTRTNNKLNFQLSLLGKQLVPVEAARDLGVILDTSLTFNNHVTAVTSWVCLLAEMHKRLFRSPTKYFYLLDTELLQVWPLQDYPNYANHADQVISFVTRDIIISINGLSLTHIVTSFLFLKRKKGKIKKNAITKYWP